jgi:hypothetical protein
VPVAAVTIINALKFRYEKIRALISDNFLKSAKSAESVVQFCDDYSSSSLL